MIARFTGHMVVVAAVVVVVYFIGLVGIELTKDKRPPVVVLSAAFQTMVARAGDTVPLNLSRFRQRDCPGVVHEIWMNDGVSLQGTRRPATNSPGMGQDDRPILKRLPDNLTPGTWCYTPVVVFTCPDGIHPIRQPAACIEIVP